MEEIYRVTETNVDGCGGSATEFVKFAHALTQSERTGFQNALNHAKTTAGENDDTAAMIEAALEQFGEGELCEAPYAGAFEF